MSRLALGAALATTLALGCATTPQPTPTVVDKPTAKSAPRSQSDIAPRLVVLIVLDQFGSWVLNEHLPLLPSDSVIRRAYEDGAFHTAAFPYSSTQTAPGHASRSQYVAQRLRRFHDRASFVTDSPLPPSRSASRRGFLR